MLDLKGKRLILASQSPRRAALLRLLRLEFEVMDSGVEEDKEQHTIPEVHVLELAERKAWKVAKRIDAGIIVGADTVVELDGQILGKPNSDQEARDMLHRLSGKTHTVYTGFALVDQPTGKCFSEFEKTRVVFRCLEDEEIETYIKTDSPLDKAGAYGIQDLSAVFAERIDGCFYNVVGFPLTKFYLCLRAFCR
ncbi:MAG: Maf family protein [bacterium]